MNANALERSGRPPENRLLEVLELLADAHALVSGEVEETVAAAERDVRLAIEYERTAALYRRRAARRPEDSERLSKSADWFERRARIKRTGMPMPRDLRTMSETMARVDELRQTIVVLLEIAGDLDAVDLRTFGDCLNDGGGGAVGDGDLKALIASASRLLAELGGRVAEGAFELEAYTVPLVERSARVEGAAAEGASTDP